MKKHIYFVSGFFRWSIIRIIGNSKIAKMTMLIPLLGYLIIFSDYATIFIAETMTYIDQDIHEYYYPKIFLVYFGLCFIALGQAGYQLFCPGIIKKYESDFEFINDNKNSMSIQEMSYIAENYNIDENLRRKFNTLQKNIDEETHEITKKTEIDMQHLRIDLLSKVWNNNNFKLEHLIIFIMSLYLIGFAILGAISVDSTFRVLSIFMQLH